MTQVAGRAGSMRGNPDDLIPNFPDEDGYGAAPMPMPRRNGGGGGGNRGGGPVYRGGGGGGGGGGRGLPIAQMFGPMAKFFNWATSSKPRSPHRKGDMAVGLRVVLGIVGLLLWLFGALLSDAWIKRTFPIQGALDTNIHLPFAIPIGPLLAALFLALELVVWVNPDRSPFVKFCAIGGFILDIIMNISALGAALGVYDIGFAFNRGLFVVGFLVIVGCILAVVPELFIAEAIH